MCAAAGNDCLWSYYILRAPKVTNKWGKSDSKVENVAGSSACTALLMCCFEFPLTYHVIFMSNRELQAVLLQLFCPLVSMHLTRSALKNKIHISVGINKHFNMVIVIGGRGRMGEQWRLWKNVISVYKCVHVGKGEGMRDREQAVSTLTPIVEFQIPPFFFIYLYVWERKRNCVRVKIQSHAESAGIKFEW